MKITIYGWSKQGQSAKVVHDTSKRYASYEVSRRCTALSGSETLL
jgi:hypothetical protein